MKKIFILSALVFSVISWTGCVGDAPETLIGEWEMLDIDKQVLPKKLEFQEDSICILTNLFSGDIDTGRWEVSANIENKFVTISGLVTVPGEVPMNGKYTIIKLTENALIIATKDWPGLTVRDFVKIQ